MRMMKKLAFVTMCSTLIAAGCMAKSDDMGMTMAKPTMDIIQTATGPGMEKVTTLVAAVKAAGLVDTLKGPGPFTVFAPTNEAFAKLPAGTVEDLLKPENKDKLVKILTFHVVSGDNDAKAVMGMTAPRLSKAIPLRSRPKTAK